MKSTREIKMKVYALPIFDTSEEIVLVTPYKINTFSSKPPKCSAQFMLDKSSFLLTYE